MSAASRVVMKRDDGNEEDEMEPRQALPVVEGWDANGTCDWQQNVPSTAEEYLRMVRQEAAQMPDVVSKAVESSSSAAKSNFDQLAAQFEDVEACPDDLLPSAEWEDCFLEYFSSVRESYARALSNRHRGVQCDVRLPPAADEQQWLDLCFREKAQPPTLSHIAKSDSRLRGDILWTMANILKKGMDDPSLLRRHGGSWLFSFLVATDKPADPDTTAALRSIVRSLCARRAVAVSCAGEEPASLNILISIIGTYFGQLEARPTRQDGADEEEEEVEWEEDEEWEGDEEYDEEDAEETGPADVEVEVEK